VGVWVRVGGGGRGGREGGIGARGRLTDMVTRSVIGRRGVKKDSKTPPEQRESGGVGGLGIKEGGEGGERGEWKNTGGAGESWCGTEGVGEENWHLSFRKE
jgi:hypothetical protein